MSSIASINSTFGLPQVNISLADARRSQASLQAEASRQINSDGDLRENANMGSRDIRIRQTMHCRAFKKQVQLTQAHSQQQDVRIRLHILELIRKV